MRAFIRNPLSRVLDSPFFFFSRPVKRTVWINHDIELHCTPYTVLRTSENSKYIIIEGILLIMKWLSTYHLLRATFLWMVTA